MKRFLNPWANPRGGWRFQDPDDGYFYDRKYRTYAELERHVILYRKQNKLPPIEKLRPIVEHYLCQEREIERSCCPVSEQVNRNFEQYVKGARTWIRAVFEKTKFVKPQISEKRAKTCVECQGNVKNYGHNHAQFYSDQFLRSEVGSRKTPHDKELFTCKYCSCLLAPKVHWRSKLVAGSLSESDIVTLTTQPRSVTGKPHRCWQLDALETMRQAEGDDDELE